MFYGASSTLPSAICLSVVWAALICARPNTRSSSGRASSLSRSWMPTHSRGSTGASDPGLFYYRPNTGHLGLNSQSRSKSLHERNRLFSSTMRKCPSGWDTHCILKLVHEGEIARRYISLIALLAHPAPSRVTISGHPSVDMFVAQLAVLVTPARRNQPSSRADRQSLVGRRIVSTLAPTFSCWLQFRPYLYLSTPYDGYILRFVVFGDCVRSLKLLFFPSPVWVKHHPDIKTLPIGTEISQLQSDYSWFLFFLTSQNRGPCFFIEELQHGAEVSALAE